MFVERLKNTPKYKHGVITNIGGLSVKKTKKHLSTRSMFRANYTMGVFYSKAGRDVQRGGGYELSPTKVRKHYAGAHGASYCTPSRSSKNARLETGLQLVFTFPGRNYANMHEHGDGSKTKLPS